MAVAFEDSCAPGACSSLGLWGHGRAGLSLGGSTAAVFLLCRPEKAPLLHVVFVLGLLD